MNRRKLVIPVGLLFFILLIYTSSGFNESKFLFVLRHLLVFSLVVYIVVEGQVLIRDYLLTKFNDYTKKERLIKVGTGVMGAIVLLIMSTLQIAYITENELVSNIECQIFGPNNYLIYISDTKYCPEITTEPIPSDSNSRTIVYEGFDFAYKDSEIPSSFHLEVEYGPNGEIKERTQYIRIYEGYESYSLLKITEKSILTTELITITQEYAFPVEKSSDYIDMEDIVTTQYDEPFKTVVYTVEMIEELHRLLVITNVSVTENNVTTTRKIGQGTFEEPEYSYSLFNESKITNTYITHIRNVYQYTHLHSIDIYTGDDDSNGTVYYNGTFYEYMRSIVPYSENHDSNYVALRTKQVDINEKLVTGGFYTYQVNTNFNMHIIKRLGTNSKGELDIERSEKYLLTYDYEQQIYDLDRYDTYYLYTKNPLIEYVYIVLGGDFIG